MSTSYNVKLEVFEGPLDLLVYLIKKNEIDIYNIPISTVLEQYMEYINIMKLLSLDIAGDFLVMASNLMLIKSKMLLPVEKKDDDEIEDPRTELVDQILKYQEFKQASKYFSILEEKQKNVFTNDIDKDKFIDENKEKVFNANIFDLISAFSKVLKNATKEFYHKIVQEKVSIQEKIADIIELLKEKNEIEFQELFINEKSRLHIIVTFLAVLELIKVKQIKTIQIDDEIKIIPICI